eukprot:GFUD01014775.1.p1 GENE.GFUD01014775.1~~GFUD01014775.1.p1  ORF type:complete len:120 (+),score=23.19 GFUD01014775.1:73-432(+)
MGYKIQNIFLLLVSSVHICSPCSKVFRAGELSSSCLGSVTLYDEVGSACSLFTSTNDSLSEGLRVKMAKLEGCGCYTLYEESNRGGRSVVVTRRGKQTIELEMVKSVFREDCRVIDKNS